MPTTYKHLRITLLPNLIGTSLSVWYLFIPIFQLYKLYFKQKIFPSPTRRNQ